MQYVLTQFKIKPNCIRRTVRFLKNLNRRQKEMNAVLKEAGILLDCSFVSNNSLYIFKKIGDLKRLKKKIKSSDLPIYEDIRMWAVQCLKSRKDIKALATFGS